MKNVIIGSRGSDLALWQANFVKGQLEGLGLTAEIQIIKTQGDQIQHLSFDKLEGKGFFTKEIEEALLSGTIDIAVHSHKDIPTTSPAGLVIAAVSEREDPSELLLIRKEAVDKTQKFNLKQKAVVGTSSSRRKSQLLSFRQDIDLEELRGNVPTRIQKLRDKQYDAIMLAAAGVDRLKIDLSEFHVEILSPLEFVPAPAQGVLAIQVREKDSDLIKLLQKISSHSVLSQIALERKVLNLFDGGCQLPLGVYCKEEQGNYHLWVAKAKSWNSFPVRLYKKLSAPVKESVENIAAELVNKITHLKPQSVFVSRDLDEEDYLFRALTENNFTVHGQSLIRTEAIPYKSVPESEWIFFCSKNAVDHFFIQEPKLNDNIKFAAIGNSTAHALKEYGMDVSFIGNNSDTIEVAKAFGKENGKVKVAVPQSERSLKTVAAELKKHCSVSEFSVYKTHLLTDVKIPETDIVVLTSPSNVEAYFSSSKKGNKKFIAIGTSTGKKLKEKGVKDFVTPYLPQEVFLAETVFSI